MPLPARTELVGDPDWLESLLDATANGTSLLAWARIEGNPAARTVNKWCKDREDIKSRLAHARVSGGEHRMEEIIVAARGPVDDAGNYDPSQDTSVRVARDKLKVDTGKWVAGVYDPERLGQDRHARRGTGSIVVQVVTGVPTATMETTARIHVETVDSTPQVPHTKEDTRNSAGKGGDPKSRP